jgi:hypothetical protein
MLEQTLLNNPIALLEFIAMILSLIIMTKLGIDIFATNCKEDASGYHNYNCSKKCRRMI